MKTLIIFSVLLVIPSLVFSGECEKITARESVVCLEEKITFLTNSLVNIENKLNSVISRKHQQGSSQIKSNLYSLPKRQWVPVEVSMPILNGEVEIYINKIEEYRNVAGRTVFVNVQIDVPKRESYIYNISKSGSKKFEYRGKSYQLKVLDIELEDQRAKITIVSL